MGNGNEKLKILKNHEADIERIRAMERIADQEAEIKRIAEQNNYKLGMEEIKRLREKDLMEYEFKNKELDTKHEEFIMHENNRHQEETEKMKKDYDIKKEEIDERREYHKGLVEVEKAKAEKEI